MKYTLLIVLLCCTIEGFAQPQTAHVRFNAIVQSLPEAKAVSDSLAQQAAQLQQRITSMKQEAERQQAQLQQDALTLDATTFQIREKQVEELLQQAQTFREQAQQTLKAREQALLQPIIQSVRDAIQTIADERGFLYVLDADDPSTIYANTKNELTDAVIEYLINNPASVRQEESQPQPEITPTEE